MNAVLIIDRMEEGKAVCEYAEGETLVLPAELLPEEAKEGSALRIVLDEEKTVNQKAQAEELRKRLFGG